MIINGIDVSTFNVRQHTVEIGHADIAAESSWISGALLPYFGPAQIKLKRFIVTVIVKGENRQDIIRNRSNLLALLIGPADIELDGFDTHFRGVLNDHKETEVSIRRWHKIELAFDGYEYMDSVTYSGTGSVTVYNPGNLVSPCIARISTSVGVALLEITGLCRDAFTGEGLPVKVPELHAGSPVIMDGITGLITEDEKLKEVEAWALPSVVPGETIVTCDSEYVTLTVTVLPLVM